MDGFDKMTVSEFSFQGIIDFNREIIVHRSDFLSSGSIVNVNEYLSHVTASI